MCRDCRYMNPRNSSDHGTFFRSIEAVTVQREMHTDNACKPLLWKVQSKKKYKTFKVGPSSMAALQGWCMTWAMALLATSLTAS